MSKHTNVSIIMAEYNTDVFYLKRAIKSILDQTFKNFEFIIIDDCGKNNVTEIVSEFNDKRIKVYRNRTNKGLVYSLNRAISLSRGDYIVRMDTDDFSYPNRLELQYKFIKSHPEYSVVAMRCVYFDGNKNYGVSAKKGDVTRNEMLSGTPIVHPTVIMQKRDIVAVNCYPKFKRCEDYALWIELFIKNYKLYVMPEIGIQYTIRQCDYKKRNLKTRSGLFELINTEYKKLNPTKLQLLEIKIKNIIAGLLPSKLMLWYHKSKCKVSDVYYEKN